MEIQTPEETKKRSCGWWPSLEFRTLIFSGYIIFKSMAALYVGVASMVKGSPVVSGNYLNALDKVQPNHVAMFPYVSFFLGITCIIFAILLIVGVAKRKSGYILTFLIFWLIFTILKLLGTILIIKRFSESGQYSILNNFLSSPYLWIGQTFNICGLLLTYLTFKKIRGEQKQFAHGRLSES